MDLAGRRAVVTGGGRGIGAATCRALAAAGAAVLVAARSSAEVEAVAEEIRGAGGSAHAARVDVTDPDSIAALAALAEARLGGVDLLVNNAGIASSAPLKSTPLEEWTRILTVNATGSYLVTRALIGGMLERRWGRVVTVASIAGLRGAAYITAYTASKHAVVGFTRALAAEVAARGVTVNAVCPGYVDTPMTEESIARIVAKTGLAPEEARARIVATNPQGRMIDPEEVAYAVACLCDERARGINGQAIAVDGGITAS
ncbi:MAG: SDR family NAD(P)-dependent oxidoreductase [Thermoanaerobaculia bacterium]